MYSCQHMVQCGRHVCVSTQQPLVANLRVKTLACLLPTCCRSRFQTNQIAQLSLVVLTLNCIWLVCYTPWRPICCSTCQLRHSLQCVHCEFLPFLNSLIQHLLLLLFVSQLSIMITTCIQHIYRPTHGAVW